MFDVSQTVCVILAGASGILHALSTCWHLRYKYSKLSMPVRIHLLPIIPLHILGDQQHTCNDD